MSGESGSRASARRMSLIAPAVGKPGRPTLGCTAVVLPQFLRARAGTLRQESGTDARKVADSQQVVRNVCLGERTLDQESPGSSPGGAIKPGNDLAVVGLCLFTRLP
jgi:hypothetical protein